MEPIPAAEAVVINKRIEAKLYPQSNISQNYFFHDFSDQESPYLSSSSMLRSSLSFSNRTSRVISKGAFSSSDNLGDGCSSVPDRHKLYANEHENDGFEEKLKSNFVSTITKRPVNKF